jgi:hypothetical protein
MIPICLGLPMGAGERVSLPLMPTECSTGRPASPFPPSTPVTFLFPLHTILGTVETMENHTLLRKERLRATSGSRQASCNLKANALATQSWYRLWQKRLKRTQAQRSEDRCLTGITVGTVAGVCQGEGRKFISVLQTILCGQWPSPLMGKYGSVEKVT